MKEKEKLLEYISMGSLGLGAFLFFFRTDFILRIVGLVLVFLIAPLALILSHYIGKKSKEEEDELWLGYWKLSVDEAIGGTNLDRFYVECVLARCTDFSLPKNRAKAALFAEKYALSYSEGIETLFLEARANHGCIGEELRDERLERLSEQERWAYKESMEYAHYRGKDKMRVMLTHSIQALRQESSLIIDNAASRTPTLEKEHNWGVWGGIADGLAGPGAGVAVAMNTQIKNTEICERNNMKLNATLGLWTLAAMDAAEITREADQEQRYLDSLPEKLLDDTISSQDVFAQLDTPRDVKVEVSETGAFRVTASIKAKYPLKIFGDVSAIADGTILAHVYEDGQLVGTATMVLPKRGISSHGMVPVMGICLHGAHPEKKQTVQFEAGKMWMIEY